MPRKVVDLFYEEIATGERYKETARFTVETMAYPTRTVRLRNNKTYVVRYVAAEFLSKKFRASV